MTIKNKNIWKFFVFIIPAILVLSGCSIIFNEKQMTNYSYEETIIFQDWPEDAQNRDIGSSVSEYEGAGGGALGTEVVIQDVPAYTGYRGCGPTAAAMILGYYDGHGFPDLVAGDASSQTSAVNNMISSQGNWDDYCEPLDLTGPILSDKSEYPIGDEHSDDCIADFMKTSQSFHDNRYSWSWFSDVDDALEDYVNWATQQYQATATNLQYKWGGLSWSNFCAEIDANRPMVLLIDSNGNNDADHFVTAIGYREYDNQQDYGCYDTWTKNIKWYDFTKMAYDNDQGVYGATFCELTQLGSQLAYSPSSYDFGTLNKGVIDFTTFEIWNGGAETLTYSISESCNWVEVTPTSGISSGEHDQIMVSIDTTGLSNGNHYCNININSDGGTGVFTVSVNVVSDTQQTDQEQTNHDNEFAAYSNNWIAQSFKPSKDLLTRIELYVNKKGSPPTDLVVSIRESITGPDLTTVSKSSGDIPSDINWIEFNFNDISVNPEDTYYIIVRTTSGNNFNAYEWGFGYYTQYNRGSFWKSRSSGSTWTEYTVYDFCFKTYGNSGDGYPPNVPSIPSGPINLITGVTGSYSTSATDPDGDQVQYRFYWGDGTFSSWTSLVSSGQSASESNNWNNAGTYVVKAQARDQNGMISGWSNGLTVLVSEVQNNDPYTPSIPSGPSNLNTGQTGSYSTSATDPDGDQVQYRFDWNDGEISTWTNLVNSGTTASKDHQWTTPGTYYIKAQTRDEHYATSSWSSSKTVTISTAVEQLDQEQTQHNNDYSTYSINWIAQSFKPTVGTLTSVELYVGKDGSPPTDLVVSIRQSITGSDLVVISKSAGEFQSNLNWIEFDFEDISITPDDTYYIVIRTSGGNNFNAYEWGFGYYDPYNRGSFWKSSSSGSTWTEYTYYDFCFKTYGEPVGPPVSILSYSPSSYDFGNVLEGITASTSFQIWNSGTGTLSYTLTETSSWITSITPSSGTSTGEYDTININIDTTGLTTGFYSYDVSINSNGGNNIFTVSLNVVIATEQLDQEQTQQDNKFAAYSNNWIAQSFKPSKNLLTKMELFIGKKGNPPTNLVVSIRESITGSDLVVISKSAGEFQSNLNWIEFDFEDISITPDDTYYIVIRTSGGNNFNAYEWGFGYYDPYNRGSFWRSLNSGSSWTEYTYYDFCFKTYGM